MQASLWVLICLLGATLVYVVLYTLQVWRLSRIIHKPFSTEWERILKRILPQYVRWSEEVQNHFHKKIQQFLKHKRFVGLGGLSVAEEIQVTVAAFACLLVLKQTLKSIPYPNVIAVHVYPDELVVRNGLQDVSGRTFGRVFGWGLSRLWQRHNRSRVLLSWRERESMVYDFNQGRNTVLAERVYFDKNDSDEASAVVNTVLLHSRGAFGTWAAASIHDMASTAPDLWREALVWQKQFGALTTEEFFSAATEHFFSQPDLLRQSYPDLYQYFQRHYQIDPLG